MAKASLSTEPITNNDEPIAEVFGGEDDEELIYLNKGPCCNSCSSRCSKPKVRKCCGGCLGGCNEGGEEYDVPPPNPKEGVGSLFPVPAPKTEHIFCFGPTGSGKSYFCANYANCFVDWQAQLGRQVKVYLISYVPEERGSPIDTIKGLVRVPIEHIVINKFTAKSIKDCMVIFDDVDAEPPEVEKPEDHEKPKSKKDDPYEPKNIFTKVEKIRNQLLTTGRHNNVSILVTSHLGADAIRTKKPINECAAVVVFPNGGAWHQVDRILSNYCGLSKKQEQTIKALPSRWVFLHKTAPNYIIHEKGVYLL